MKRMKKLIRAAAGFLSVLALTALMCVNVLAGQEEMAFVVIGVNGDEVISASPAYVIDENGTYFVLGDISVVNGDAERYVLANATDEKEYPLVFENKNIREINLAIFSFQDELPPGSQIALPGIVMNGQTVDMLYLDRELNPVSIKVKVTGAQDTGKSYLLLDMEAAEAVGEYLAPTLYLDDSGCMVAVGTSAGANAAFYTDIDAFHGGSGSGSDENNGGGSNGNGGSGSSGTGDGLSRSGPDTTASAPNPDSESWWKQHWLLLAAGIVGGIVVIVIAVRASSKSRNNSGSSDAPSDDGIPDSPVEAVFISDSTWAPVSPVPGQSVPPIPQPIPPSPQPVPPSPQPIPPSPQPVPQPSPSPGYQTLSATIIGTAGNMVNQVYTVTSSGLTFGRDASCFVRFPADAKGVSRIHCRLQVDGGGNLILTDCNATYGTHVKKYGTTKPIRLDANSSVRLQKGDKFYLGSNNISFQVRQAPGGKDI